MIPRRSFMLRTSCFAALSLTGASCAGVAALVGGRKDGGGRRPAAAPAAPAGRTLVSEAALGPLSLR